MSESVAMNTMERLLLFLYINFHKCVCIFIRRLQNSFDIQEYQVDKNDT